MKTCVILAGGKSSRMGSDKTLLPFRGFATLTHYQFEKLNKIFTNVFVSSKFDKFDPVLPIIKDHEITPVLAVKEGDGSEFSPMLALACILRNFKNESVFVIPADMPFVSEACIRELYEYSNDFDIVVAKDRSYTHSLCGFYHTSLAEKAAQLYAYNRHKIGLLHEFGTFKAIDFGDEKQFFNINYPDEYEAAIKGAEFEI